MDNVKWHYGKHWLGCSSTDTMHFIFKHGIYL